jgi:hypothetical protein
MAMMKAKMMAAAKPSRHSSIVLLACASIIGNVSPNVFIICRGPGKIHSGIFPHLIISSHSTKSKNIKNMGTPISAIFLDFLIDSHFTSLIVDLYYRTNT